jgi:hypothetical protein
VDVDEPLKLKDAGVLVLNQLVRAAESADA